MINKPIKTVHLIGLGAIGSTYGSILYKSDKDSIKVILDEGRLNSYQNGIIINGETYRFDYIVPKDGDAKAELILLSVKGHHLDSAVNLIKPLVGSDTIILSLLNGITSEDDLSKVFGRDKVLHGFCVGTDALREKGEVTFNNKGKIVFGEFFPEAKGKGEAVAELFDRAGVPYSIPSDIRREMWWKFMMNVGINQTSAILGATYDVYRKIPEARELMASACREVLPLAQKEGISLSEDDIQKYIDIFNTLTPAGKTSMLQDIEAGRKTEVESFSLAVMNLGKKHGIPTPINDTLYLMIRTLELKG